MRKKVLHIVGSLDVGGIEKWVCNMVNFESENENEIDFYILSMDPDKKSIVHQLKLKNDHLFYSNTRSIFSRLHKILYVIKQIQPDIIHCHPGYSSGMYAFVAKLKKIKKVIVHSHSDRRRIDKNESVLKKTYILMMKFLIRIFSDYKIAVSTDSGYSMFTSDFEVHYCGVPSISNQYKLNHNILEEIKNDNRNMIFHIGRDSEAKNYPFIIKLAEKLAKNSRYIIVCIGGGLEKYESEVKIKELENIKFIGFQDNPMEIISQYASLFIMPSLWEGLPLSAVESQKCNIPTLLSENITHECDIGLATFLPLNADIWCDAIAAKINDGKINNNLLDCARFSLQNDMNFFKKIYSAS